MAYIAQGAYSRGASFTRTHRGSNARPADEKFIGIKEEEGPGGGSGSGSGSPTPTPTIPTEGIIWWPRK